VRGGFVSAVADFSAFSRLSEMTGCAVDRKDCFFFFLDLGLPTAFTDEVLDVDFEGVFAWVVVEDPALFEVLALDDGLAAQGSDVFSELVLPGITAGPDLVDVVCPMGDWCGACVTKTFECLSD
jgi:hypothetical protein